MKVSELKKQIEKMDDDMELIVVAPNAPPWITQFTIIPKPKEIEE
tara:strand:+ start:7157 stop:7291 length:135 start_codon:yes stop_codon:yes gene_type:complete